MSIAGLVPLLLVVFPIYILDFFLHWEERVGPLGVLGLYAVLIADGGTSLGLGVRRLAKEGASRLVSAFTVLAALPMCFFVAGWAALWMLGVGGFRDTWQAADWLGLGVLALPALSAIAAVTLGRGAAGDAAAGRIGHVAAGLACVALATMLVAGRPSGPPESRPHHVVEAMAEPQHRAELPPAAEPPALRERERVTIYAGVNSKMQPIGEIGPPGRGSATAPSAAVREDDAATFVERLREGSAEGFIAAADHDALAGRMKDAAGVTLAPAVLQEGAQALVQQAADHFAAFASDPASSLRLTRATPQSDGTLFAWVRIATPDMFDFVEFHLVRRGDAVVAADWRGASDGEWVSRTGAEALRQGAAIGWRKAVGSETETDRLFLAIDRAGGLPPEIEALGPEAGLRWLDRLPPELQASRLVRQARVRVAHQVSQEAFLAAVDRYAADAGQGMDVDKFRLAAAAMMGDGPAAEAAAGRLEALIGQDACLDATVATAWWLAGNGQRAKDLANQAVAAEPRLADGWLVLLNVALAERDHPEAARCLDHIAHIPGAMLDLEDDPAAAEFLRSEPYLRWRRGQERDAKEPSPRTTAAPR